MSSATEDEFTVTEIEFNQGLLQCDYTSLAEVVYQYFKRRVVLEFYGCKDCVHWE